MGYIFISYSHKDKDYVHKLQEALQKEGFEVWIDDRIDYGSRWPKVIQDQLDACDAFVVVVSENSYESEWVQNEVTRAKRKGKPSFPLLLSGDTWLSVETTQYEDVKKGNLPSNRFYDDLARIAPRRKIVSEQERKNLMRFMEFDERDKLAEALLQEYWEQLGNVLDAYYRNEAPSSEFEEFEKYVEKMAKLLSIPEPHNIEEQRYLVLLAKLDGSYKIAEAMIANEQRRYPSLTRKEAIERIIKRIDRYKQ